MAQTFSAYLNVFNDWEILPDTLRAVAPYVDEIVIVDGAYAWMVPYYQSIGVDPERSDPRVAAAADGLDVTVRIITGIWTNEIEKRMAGYEACSGRYIYRLDADELLLMDETELARFLASGAAVANMEMPTYVTPSLIRVSSDGAALDYQALLFDRTQISAAAHLRYIWLVLGTEELPPVEGELSPSFPAPIALNQHLTEWRTPETSVFRALFYTLNYTRKVGLPWTARVRGTALQDIAVIMRELISPAIYLDLQFTGLTVVGAAEPTGRVMRAAPAISGHDARLTALWQRFLASLAELNRQTAAMGRWFIDGEYIMIDMTTQPAVNAVTRGGKITFLVPNRPNAAAVKLYYELVDAPWEALLDVPAAIDGDRVTIDLPERLPPAAFARCILRARFWCAVPGQAQQFFLVDP